MEDHGEMGLEEAQRTVAVRVPSLLSTAEVAQLFEVYSAVRDKCGLVANKHGNTNTYGGDLASGSNDWTTTFLQTDGHFAAMLPWLRTKLIDAAIAVDRDQGWGLLDRPGVPFAVRVAEVHTVGVGGALPDVDHFDHGSLVTIDVMLSDSAGGAFEGGVLSTVESDGETLRPAAPFEMGDATVFVSHKHHCVTPVTRGTRRVLVCELWNGVERTCAHRCEHHDGECPVTLDASRAASRMSHMDSGEGLLDEDEYRNYLDEMCEAFHSDDALDRESAAATLARVVALSAAATAAAATHSGGGNAVEREELDSELIALRQHIRTQARIRANRFNFTFSLQSRPCGTEVNEASLCCTHAVSGDSMVLQACFICADCQDPSSDETKCCCESCALKCHGGHAVTQLGYGRCSCDCGAEGGCAQGHAAHSQDEADRVLIRGCGALSARATAARNRPATSNGDGADSAARGGGVPGFEVARVIGLDADRAAQLRSECCRLAGAENALRASRTSADDSPVKSSFWLQADAPPTCAIEALAALTFHHHTAGSASFDSAASGAEFWVEVAEEGASTPLHYERDEALHATFGLCVCPLVSVVTHVGATGWSTSTDADADDDAMALRGAAPTVVVATRTSDAVGSEIFHAAISYAAPATQVAFDGSLLHGAPALSSLPGAAAGAARGADPPRPLPCAIKLYVNVWLDHRPPYAKPLRGGDGTESSAGGAHARSAAFLAALHLRRCSTEDAPAIDLSASSGTDTVDVTLPLASRSKCSASVDSEEGEVSGLGLSMALPRSDLASHRTAGADTVFLHFGGGADPSCYVTAAW